MLILPPLVTSLRPPRLVEGRELSNFTTSSFLLRGYVQKKEKVLYPVQSCAADPLVAGHRGC